MTDKLITLTLPHPRNMARELANNPQQQKNSQYARNFQKEDAASKLSAEGLAMLAPEAERPKYVEAFKNSDFEAMLNYYKRNYPREPYGANSLPTMPKIQMPVLLFHGLKDSALLASALNNTWEWVEKDLTIVTVPNAGHWSHWDAAPLVTRTMRDWLSR